MKVSNIFILLCALVVLMGSCTQTKDAASTTASEQKEERIKEGEKKITKVEDHTAEAEGELERTVQEAKDDLSGAMDFRSQAPEAGPARSIDIGEYETFTLENGLQVIVVENHKIPKVSWQLSIDTDPVMEGNKAGYVSLAGQMLDQGTTNRTKEEIDETVDFMGAFFNTNASGMFASTLTKYKEDILEIMTDVLYNPAFPEEEFDKIRKQTLSSIAQAKENPNAISANVVNALRYGKNHPYGEISTEASINNISLEDCKAYYNQYFKPNKSYLVVVGDITPAEAKRLTEKYFSAWEKSEVEDKKYEFPATPTGPMVAMVPKDGAVQSVIKVTNVIDLMPGAEDLIAADVMNAILGGGVFSGRLMQNLREDKGYTYGARSQLSEDEYVGYFNAGASVRNEVTDSAVAEFLYELDRIRREPVEADELSLVKNVMSGSFARSLEQPQTIARFALNTVKYNLPEDYYETYLQRLDAVSIEDVRAAAKKYVRPDQAYITVVGNPEIAKNLEQYGADGIVHFYDAYGNPMRMSDREVPNDVKVEDVLEDYLSALGGRDKLEKMNGLSTLYSASIMGQAMELSIKTQKPGKFAMNMGNEMMSFQSQIFDGEKGISRSIQSTEAVPMDEEEMMDSRRSAAVVPELDLKGLGLTPKMTGMDNVDGKKVYKVEYLEEDGSTWKINYFDVMSSLKVKEVRPSPEGNVTMQFEDYQDVSGVLFPSKMVLMPPGLPEPIILEKKSIEINPSHPEGTFDVK